MRRETLLKTNADKLRFVPDREWQTYTLVVLISILVRVPLLETFDLVSFDGTYYINQAKTLWSSGLRAGSFPIGYPLFISLLLPVVGDGVRAAQLVSFLASLGSLVVFYRLARKHVERSYAFYATLVLAATPLFIRLSMSTFSESTYVFWMLLTILFYARANNFLTGLFGGVAAITRPEMLAVVGVFFLSRIKAPKRALLMLVPFLAVYSINVFAGYRAGGTVTLLPKSAFFAAGAQHWHDREKTLGEAAPAGAAVVTPERDPGVETETPPEGPAAGVSPADLAADYLTRLPRDVYKLARNLAFAIFVLGVVGTLRGPRYMLSALVPLFVAPFFTVRSDERYLLPYVPILILYAFLGAAAVNKPRVKRAAQLAIALALIAGPVVNYAQLTDPVDEGYTESKEVGRYLRHHVRPGDAVADRKPYVAFYAEARYVELPLATYEETLQYLMDEKVRFLSLHIPVIQKFRPSLLPLLLDEAVIAGELRFEQFHGHSEGILVYERVVEKNPLTWTRMSDPGDGFDSAPDWSPDGGSIAFSSNRSGNTDIFIVPVDRGEKPRVLVGGPGHEDQPDWSPDGRQIALRSSRSGNWDIYLFDVATKETRRITTHESDDSAPQWMPNGREIIFVSKRSGKGSLWKVDLDSGSLLQLTNDGGFDYPSVSPDGVHLAWILPGRGMIVHDLQSGEGLTVPAPKRVNYTPAWSPDGRFLAVTAGDWGSVDIYLVSADGERHLLLTKNGDTGENYAFDALPSWSPDGRRLALVSNAEGSPSLYVVDGVEAFVDRLSNPLKMITFEPEDEKPADNVP